MSRSHTYAGEHPAQNERFGLHGIPERKKFADDISKVGKYEVCTVCGNKETASIPAKGHGKWHSVYFRPSYVIKGEIYWYCEDCDQFMDSEIVADFLKLKTPKITLKAGKKSFKVTYNKVKDATGFQVRYKISGKWNVKTFNTKKTATKTINKLKKGKKYKVQVRAFIKQDGMKAYSSWTKAKKVTVK